MTVTDSDGLTTDQVSDHLPDEGQPHLRRPAPAGLHAAIIDGIAHTAPFVYDALVGFHHTIEARDQTVGRPRRTPSRRGPIGGASTAHARRAPTATSYTVTYSTSTAPAPITFVQVDSATPQTNQSTVAVTYAARAGGGGHQHPGDRLEQRRRRTITSVVDTAGNTYRLSGAQGVGERPRARPIWYAEQHQGGRGGCQHGDGDVERIDTVRGHPGDGVPTVSIQPTPSTSALLRPATARSANSGAVTTTAANELIVGAGMTGVRFSGPGTGFTLRAITEDADIAEDRIVTTAGSYSASATLRSLRLVADAGGDLPRRLTDGLCWTRRWAGEGGRVGLADFDPRTTRTGPREPLCDKATQARRGGPFL